MQTTKKNEIQNGRILKKLLPKYSEFQAPTYMYATKVPQKVLSPKCFDGDMMFSG